MLHYSLRGNMNKTIDFLKNEIKENETLITNHSIPTTRDKVVKFCEYIEEQMSDCGNFKSEERRNKLVINLRNIFTRSQLTEQELNTLYGIINHLLRK